MGDVANMADFGNINTRVSEWEAGLPTADDLTPLSQDLISRQLANAFNIKPEPMRTRIDVERASRETFSGLQRSKQTALGENSFKPFGEETNESGDFVMIDDDDEEERSDSRKIRRIEGAEEDDSSSAALRRQRIVWTPQLHKRFVDVVTHLGIKSAVPKTIMQLMNVEGLTRENVASHLQKYRLYLKRMQGTSSEGPSSSDQLFASTPASLNLPIQMPYGAAGMLPAQMFGGHGVMQQRDWSGNSNGSVVSYPHAATAHR